MNSIEEITHARPASRPTRTWSCGPLALCAGCSSGTGPRAGFQASPLSTTMTDSAALRVELWTSPQPPRRGDIDAQLRITEAKTGTPEDGLTLKILPWMPVMNHGGIEPAVSLKGDGKYLVTNVDLFMAGLWDLRTTVSGPVSDYVAPRFEIQ